jgi:DNA-binding response OmpR family regulator
MDTMEAVQGNTEPAPSAGSLEREVVVDTTMRGVRIAGEWIRLTIRELALLVYLSGRRGQLISRSEILAVVWGSEYSGGPRTLDTHVRRLRAKLGAHFPLTTVRGVGYVLHGASARLEQ